jgi:hypothetical protein
MDIYKFVHILAYKSVLFVKHHIKARVALSKRLREKQAKSSGLRGCVI